ncbi:6-carboxyhexanoate--CoA ligase [Lysinibacillus sp. LZ02]|uniref:6-carboxyhexanoate--CoA ligase n=1 Tax=Lysinibacillus sp. LZ02 TaxID=3420668 RepID=UPI003D36BC4C
MNNWYSVRMRASLHDKHISGGETLVPATRIHEVVNYLQQKAFSHSRGVPTNCHITIEAITEPLVPITMLKVNETHCHTPLHALTDFITSHGISEIALKQAIQLLHANTNLRGAALLHATTGARLDLLANRGVRVTRIAYDAPFLEKWCTQFPQYANARIEEALLLASAVASCDGIIGELCISDDPTYTTGYFGSAVSGYTRIHHMKKQGEECGGRVFFVKGNTDIEETITYLQQKPLLVCR